MDKALLETPEDELDPQTLRIRDIILLAEYRERLAVCYPISKPCIYKGMHARPYNTVYCCYVFHKLILRLKYYYSLIVPYCSFCRKRRQQHQKHLPLMKGAQHLLC